VARDRAGRCAAADILPIVSRFMNTRLNCDRAGNRSAPRFSSRSLLFCRLNKDGLAHPLRSAIPEPFACNINCWGQARTWGGIDDAIVLCLDRNFFIDENFVWWWYQPCAGRRFLGALLNRPGTAIAVANSLSRSGMLNERVDGYERRAASFAQSTHSISARDCAIIQADRGS
jgi:hypothetical protein